MTGEKDSFDVYEDKDGEWRWRRKASNGQIVGSSCEGYKNRADCEANMNRGPVAADKWELWLREINYLFAIKFAILKANRLPSSVTFLNIVYLW